MDINKLKNGKYFLGRYDTLNDCRGWFVGPFFDKGHPCKTDKMEILYREHNAGDVSKPHYHKKKVELLIMLEGRAKYNINGKEVMLEKGKFLFIDVNNIISGEFLEPSKIFVVHAPGIIGDKTIID